MQFLRKWRRKLQKDAFYRHQRGGARAAFIHINKCGGTSVEKALDIAKIHDTAQQRIALIGRDRWDAMYTFSIVRHPYSRICSLYEFRVKTGQTGMGDRSIALDDWIERVFETEDPAYRNKPLMFAPCHEWLSDETGELLVDDWFRLEELDAHWPAIKARTGAPGHLPHSNSTSGFTVGRALDRLSPASVSTLDRVFAADFEHFGYERQAAGDTPSAS